MNIGIITWFRYENYGTKLQAIALQGYLRNLGYNVELLNFNPPAVTLENLNKESLWEKIKKQPKKYKTKMILKEYEDCLKTKSIKMNKVIKEHCILSNRIVCKDDYIKVCNKYDLLICGSDQIWNPNLYNAYYYADFDTITTPIVSYAPSFGVNEVRVDVLEKLKHSLNQLKYITVREKQGIEIIKKVINKDAEMVMDPTFLLSQIQWRRLFNLKRKNKDSYVLCYFLSDNKEHWKAVNEFARKRNLKLYIIPQLEASYKQNGKICADTGVEDFVELIMNAEFMLTDSFHGTVFSLIFNKQFYTFERFKEDKFSSQNSRVKNLLSNVGLENRLYKFNSNMILENSKIDYNLANEKINKMIDESKQILNKELQYGKQM